MDEAEIYFEKETGETLVKVNIVDDNNPNESTVAVIPQEYYDRILSGHSSLSKYIDDDGKTQFMLVDNSQSDSDSLHTLNKVEQVISNTTNLHSMREAGGDDTVDAVRLDHEARFAGDKPDDEEADEQISGEQFVITEVPVETARGDYFSVVITDSQDNHVFEKDGRLGETILLELMGQTISYLISGCNEDGSHRQTKIYFNNSDVDKAAVAKEIEYVLQIIEHFNDSFEQ